MRPGAGAGDRDLEQTAAAQGAPPPPKRKQNLPYAVKLPAMHVNFSPG